MSTSYGIDGIILLACGSFNPPTPKHLRMFEIARDHLRLIGSPDILGGIVSPVHDSFSRNGLVSAIHRCSMLSMALFTSDWIKLSDWECNQNEWMNVKTSLQYHQNCINEFKKKYHSGSSEVPSWLPAKIKSVPQSIQVKLLCGVDMLESFNQPSSLWSNEDIEDILVNHGLIIVSKNGFTAEKCIFESDLLSKNKRHITIVTNWISNDISSSMIRKLLRRGQSVKYLLDDVVIDYIHQNNLFKTTARSLRWYLSEVIEYDDEDVADCSGRRAISEGRNLSEDVMAATEDEKSIRLAQLQLESNPETQDDEPFSLFLRRAIADNRLKIVKRSQCYV